MIDARVAYLPCSLGHRHRVELVRAVDEVLDELGRRPGTNVELLIRGCPIAPVVEARGYCPNCGRGFMFRDRFCCAFPLDE